MDRANELLTDSLREQNRKIIDHYGEDEQLMQLTEECAELIQAASKVRRARIKDDATTQRRKLRDLKMEMVDVIILLDQLIGHLDVGSQELWTMENYKIIRQLARIKKEKDHGKQTNGVQPGETARA